MRRTFVLLAAGCVALAACSAGQSGGHRAQRTGTAPMAAAGARSSGEPAGTVPPPRPTGQLPANPVPPPGTTGAGPSHGTVPENQTVLGMHFVQMRSTVAPVAAALHSGIGSGRVATSPDQLQRVEAALDLFDSAANRTAAPGGLAGPIQALVRADRALLSQLEAVGAGPGISPPAAQALTSALENWESATSAAGTALSA